jgi:hypothetical protein
VYQQAVLEIANPQTFGAVRGAIETAFSAARVADFLKSVERAGLRIRDFEAVLKAGRLGASAKAEYGQLENVDQGQIREFYLASLEKVAPELRQKFFKLYAYYWATAGCSERLSGICFDRKVGNPADEVWGWIELPV